MFGIKTKIKYLILKNQWMKNHPDSFPMYYFDPSIVSMGHHSYGELNVTSFNNRSHLYIGNFVSIAQHVTFLLDVEHNISTISTYPLKTKVLKNGDEAGSKGNIVVDDDVWIGYGATILSGVHLSQGAVIAAGAVVTSDVPPYAIVGGVPAKVIKYRFTPPVIDFMLTLDYEQLTEELIKAHVDGLYTEIDDMELEEIKELFSWFPKKEGDENDEAIK